MRNKYKGEDIRSRLHGTVIRHKGIPYIADVESNTIGLIDLVKGDLVSRVEPDDDNLDISSIPLGYVNLNQFKITTYVRREPLRRYKQGVEISYVTQKPLNSEGSLSNKYLKGQEIFDCVTGNYPNLSVAIRKLTTDGWSSIAISRNIALRRLDSSLKVYFKDSDVGVMRLGSKKVVIKRDDLSFVIKNALEKIKDWIVVEE